MPQKIIRPNEIYWLFFKIEFLEIIKRDRKKIATKREREYISATKLSMFLKASIIRIEIIIAAITWGNFVNLKNCFMVFEDLDPYDDTIM